MIKAATKMKRHKAKDVNNFISPSYPNKDDIILDMRGYEPDEHPGTHWDQVPIKGNVILDLGAGHWNSCVPTTPEWFLAHGAKQVIAVDINAESLKIIKSLASSIRGSKGKIETINKKISSSRQISELINRYAPDAIKCDIEGAEVNLIDLGDRDFAKVRHYSVECHLFVDEQMTNRLREKFKRCGYLVQKCWSPEKHNVEIISASLPL